MNSSNAVEVSLVIPCLNEAETLAACIRKAHQAISAHDLSAEIIVADNGSSDNSSRIAETLGARVVFVASRGYGAALRGGVEAAKGTYIVMGDADDSYDFGAIFPFIEALRAGFDLVMGCRMPGGGGTLMPGAMPWKHRYIGNPVLTGIGRLFFATPLHDFHCGLRAFTREAFNRMDLRTTGMEFASEMVIKATQLQMRITEIPVTLHRDGRSRPSHLRSWHDGWRHLRFMLMYAPQWLFFTPGMFLVMAGSALFGLLTIGPLKVGQVVFDTNTLLVSSMMILLGAQLISFYLFTRVFAESEGLLPEDAGVRRFLSLFSLEAGILIGIFLVIAGGGFLVLALRYWSRQHFGALSYPEGLRLVIPSVTLVILGAQVVFSSFFVSILGLNRR